MAQGSNRGYLLLCGRDYSSFDGAVDIMSSVPIDTMSSCIEQCASHNDCIGAGWGNYNGENLCWLKSALGKPNWSYNWYFAILDVNATKSS
jgi:hypothetical protein